MKIVIDITDETYEYLTPKEPREMTNKTAAEWFVVLHKAIFVNGKPLPKGHGRLIEASEELFQAVRKYGGKDGAFEVLANAPTIIEADKEADDDK